MILNLTQHSATAEQSAAGVVDLTGDRLLCLKALLTFEELPTRSDIEHVAQDIAIMARFCFDVAEDKVAMIGGAPFLMGALEATLLDYGITPVYAFSKRDSVEEVQSDGSVTKRNVFRHAGFI